RSHHTAPHPPRPLPDRSSGSSWTTNGPSGGRTGRAQRSTSRSAADRLQLAPDGAELVTDLTAQEEQSDDSNDRDEGENECVFGETLPLLGSTESCEKASQRGPECHEVTSFRPDRYGSAADRS